MTNKRALRIGFDFDGVIAYSPTRLIRAPISWFKRNILHKGVSYFVPKHDWQMAVWAAIFNPSVFPEKGLEKLKYMANNKMFESHLITGRFDFLEKNMLGWLTRHKAGNCFKTINVNTNKQQPHRFKENLIFKLKLDYYIDDNLDTVLYLEKKCVNTKILWIYNIVDKRHNYPYKFPDLEKTLRYVEEENFV